MPPWVSMRTTTAHAKQVCFWQIFDGLGPGWMFLYMTLFQ